MRVGVIGINHKLAELKLRESFAKICQRRFHPEAHTKVPLVLLSTCNRAEVYFSSPVLAETHSLLLNIFRQELFETFDQKLYSYFGLDCFRHLAQVTAGLDSAILGETEIQGQVKAAYEASSKQTYLPSELHFLFQKSLKIGKEIRSKLFMGRGMPDLEHAVLNTGFNFFREPSEAKILIVGASLINEKIISFFKSKNLQNITICNRSNPKAHLLGEKHLIDTLPWNELSSWSNYDWVIFGTKASDYLITRKDLPQSLEGEKLLIDLSVPRNVDPKLGKDPRITLLNIDQIDLMLHKRRQKMSHILAEANELVILSAKNQINLFHERQENRLSITSL